MTTHRFLDVHILHAVPFSNLNRDNLGTPKQMVFGGVARARISSQCTKRAARLWLEENTNLGQALRTRRLPQLLREELKTHGFSDENAPIAVQKVFDLAGIKVSENTNGDLQGDQLTFTTAEAARLLAVAVIKHEDEILSDKFKPKKAVKEELLQPFTTHNTVIALCGRMLAESAAGVNVEGALQVAHAFTTHVSAVEQDYFTAVDDVIQGDDEETGAGHINVNEFTSGVFYRHITLGLDNLWKLLDESNDATAEAAGSVIRAFTLAEPTGKQNAANAHTRPALVAVTLRSDRPVSYAAAFEQAVIAGGKGGGYISASIIRMADHASAEAAFYGSATQADAWYAVNAAVAPNKQLNGLGMACETLEGLVVAVEMALTGGTS